MQRWIVKAGSRMVCEGGPLLMRAWMQQVAQLHAKYDIQIIWVTSGAIAWATEQTHFKSRRRTLPQKQALSAIGQPLIMDQYNLALRATGLLGSQVLLTANDMRDKKRRQNLKNTLNELLRWKVIPILNENDAVSTDEIQFGDNDSLASQVAIMMKAKRLILLTDVDGFYSANPAVQKNAELISYRAKISPADLRATKGTPRRGSVISMGTGGMYSKLLAAECARRCGIVTCLMRGDRPKGLIEIAKGISNGTQIGGRLGPTK
jgi:glutamate 5-kinase